MVLCLLSLCCRGVRFAFTNFVFESGHQEERTINGLEVELKCYIRLIYVSVIRTINGLEAKLNWYMAYCFAIQL